MVDKVSQRIQKRKLYKQGMHDRLSHRAACVLVAPPRHTRQNCQKSTGWLCAPMKVNIQCHQCVTSHIPQAHARCEWQTEGVAPVAEHAVYRDNHSEGVHGNCEKNCARSQRYLFPEHPPHLSRMLPRFAYYLIRIIALSRRSKIASRILPSIVGRKCMGVRSERLTIL